MNKEFISVIIPVYNVEKYLNRCVDSILKQTYQNFEIILVDDGSTDNSSSLCDEYAKNDNRINVFHITNGGVVNARLYGVKHSIGDWIIFVDSDDWIDNTLLEILYNNAIENDADISCCTYKIKKSQVDNNIEDSNFIPTTQIISLENLYRGQIGFEIYAKLCKKCLFNFEVDEKELKFKIAEDFFLSSHLFYNAKKIIYTDARLYNYFINDASLTRVINKTNILQQATIVYEDIEAFLLNNKDYFYVKLIRQYIFNSYLNAALYYYKNGNISDSLNLINKFMKKNFNKYLFGNFSIKYKCRMIFIRFFPKLFLSKTK